MRIVKMDSVVIRIAVFLSVAVILSRLNGVQGRPVHGMYLSRACSAPGKSPPYVILDPFRTFLHQRRSPPGRDQ